MNDREPLKQERPVIKLPQERTAAVITMDFRGGYGPRRRDNRPLLTIFADGIVRVIDHSRIKASAEELEATVQYTKNSGNEFSAEERQSLLELVDLVRANRDKQPDVGPEIEAKLSAEELQDLLRFAIDEQHFFQFDPHKELEAEQERTGLMVDLFDGVTTVIRIQTSERDHEATFYGLYDYAMTYPAVKSLAQLLSVQNRLMHLVHEIDAGGKEAISAALKLANEYLRTAYPNIPALVLEDFRYSDHTPDRRTIHFVPRPAVTRELDDSDRMMKLWAPKPEFAVVVEYRNDRAPKITVSNPPQ